MHDVRVGVRAHHVHDRVGLADVGKEAVAEALAPVRPRHEPRDVVEVDRVVHDVARVQQLGEAVEALVGDGDHRDVWLDRRERVVGGRHAGLRQGVEERRLAGVRHADDADPHGEIRGPLGDSALPATAGCGRVGSEPITVPRTAPARMSEG